MAASSCRRVGRPKLPGCLRSVRLRESVFELWRARKQTLGFMESSDHVCGIPLTPKVRVAVSFVKTTISFAAFERSLDSVQLFSSCLF